MFDMMHTGKTISALRKAQNMTQMELADRLNISYQAVSNWERGQSMPDISKLSELAGIFHVTIDELLGNSKPARVVEKIIKHEPVTETLSAGDFLDVAPLAKPREAEQLWDTVADGISMEDLIKAAPFLSEHTLDTLAINAVKQEQSFAGITGLLPFLSQQAITQCLELLLDKEISAKTIIMAAPYLGTENLNRLAERFVLDCSITDLTMLAPFLQSEILTKAAAAMVEKEGFAKILPLLPFLDQSMMDEFFLRKHENRE